MNDMKNYCFCWFQLLFDLFQISMFSDYQVVFWLTNYLLSAVSLSAVGSREELRRKKEPGNPEPRTRTQKQFPFPVYSGKVAEDQFRLFRASLSAIVSLELLTFPVTICNSCDQKSLKSFVGGESFAHSQTHEFRADYSISHIFYVIEADQF